MDIVGAFDLHRKQITFDYIEMQSGEVHRGKIQPADRENLRLWLDGFIERFPGQDAAIAVEATTGWRFVLEEVPLFDLDSPERPSGRIHVCLRRDHPIDHHVAGAPLRSVDRAPR